MTVLLVIYRIMAQSSQKLIRSLFGLQSEVGMCEAGTNLRGLRRRSAEGRALAGSAIFDGELHLLLQQHPQ